uniref:FAD-binding PCMH-type domain-containing protein n=1 Tax=Vombatus ursinus TaxID=29139 RepID=A0A4X2L102_VOMUR
MINHYTEDLIKYSCDVITTIDFPLHYLKHCSHYSATACLVPICSLHGAAVTTVEGIGSIRTRIHPVQERLAKCHGTQCGFCSPGMVMSIYTLLRNYPDPTTDQLMETLSGNLCRCTGYRPIVESGKTFCEESTVCQLQGTGKCCMDQEEKQFYLDKKEKMCTKLYDESEFRPFDPSQEPIFPPELIRMAEDPQKKTLIFCGERVMWISPANMSELLELRMKYPTAPLVMGNTTVGLNKKLKGEFHPIIISPTGLTELNFVDFTDDGITIGAGCTLAEMKEILASTVSKEPKEKTKTYRALLKHLRTLAGQQIRNMATLGGHVASKHDYSDINPILSAGKTILNLISKEGKCQILIEEFLTTTSLKEELHDGEVIYSVVIPQLSSSIWDFITAQRQAQRFENAFAIVNAGMSVQFGEGTNIIKDLKMFFGRVGPTTVSASKTCEQLIGKQWNDEMLSEACRLVLDEIRIPPTAVGGMVEYKRTLIISFIFKFYLKVLRELHKLDPRMFPEIPGTSKSALEEFAIKIPQGIQMFQCVDPHQPPQDPVGHPVMHQSGLKHATGESVYNDDILRVDEELLLAVVTSTRAHAKILSIDVSEALEFPGVVDVITAKDVCYLIITIEVIILFPNKKIEKGNVDKAFKYVDEIIEGEVHVEGQEHFYMETQTILVHPTREDKEMVIHAGMQYPTHVQNFVAAALGVPRSRIMCHMKRTGGAFGGKVTKPAVLEAVAAVAEEQEGTFTKIDHVSGCKNLTNECRKENTPISAYNLLSNKYAKGAQALSFGVWVLKDISMTVSEIRNVFFFFSQVASRELKIPSSYIHLSETSTTTVPNATYTAGSMGTDINGRAVQVRFLSILSSSSLGYQTYMDWEKEEGNPYPYFVYGASCSEVEIDCLTGAHKVNVFLLTNIQ